MKGGRAARVRLNRMECVGGVGGFGPWDGEVESALLRWVWGSWWQGACWVGAMGR